MNTYNVITLFPNLIEEWKNIGIVRQAIKNELINIQTTNLREFGIGDYKQIDDAPYGGGPGMVLMPEPLDNAINSSNSEVNVFLTPSGEQLEETLLIKEAKRLKKQVHLGKNMLENQIDLAGKYFKLWSRWCKDNLL